MPRRKNTRFDVDQFMKAWKVARENLLDSVSENRKLLAENNKVQLAQVKVRWYLIWPF